MRWLRSHLADVCAALGFLCILIAYLARRLDEALQLADRQLVALALQLAPGRCPECASDTHGKCPPEPPVTPPAAT